MATVASVHVVGVMMIVAGVAEVFSAFQIKSIAAVRCAYVAMKIERLRRDQCVG